ncbi:MAG: toll/interleukin-1 receptor domain-containing protein [Gemmatimonadaceae bacterium]|jgi:hypothetical protein|nr:toll/interleukin-1 receptor domain-containing protein [Gemmatimonadaceae bacterium]
MTFEHHVFISHASADKERYIGPLASALARRRVTYWLDSNEIGWGDSIPAKINEGLRSSEYGLVCFSERFLERPWPEAELGAVLTMQHASGRKRVLPLILDGREAVLRRYPLVAALAYREFSMGADAVADELAALVHPAERAADDLQVAIESTHSGNVITLSVSRRASLAWLIDKATSHAGLRTQADVGAFRVLRVRWVLVDVRAAAQWLALDVNEQERMVCYVHTEQGARGVYFDAMRLEEAEIRDGMTFHLYALPEREVRVAYAPPRPPW